MRRGRGRQHRSSSSAARLGMPTSKGKRSGCALRAVCARRTAWLCASSGQLRTRRLLPAYPVSTPAAVFASLGLADGPPSGWAARGASRTELLWGAHAGVRQLSRTLSSHRRNRAGPRLYYIVWLWAGQSQGSCCLKQTLPHLPSLQRFKARLATSGTAVAEH